MPLVHNRGRIVGEKTIARKIIFPAGWDEDGHVLKEGKKQKTLTLLPGKHMEVDDRQYAHLMANCKGEIVNLSDHSDLKNQFKETPDAKPRSEGYMSPAEVAELVEKRVKEALAADAKTKKGVADDTPNTTGGKIENAAETDEELAARIDTLDRSAIIALIETEELNVEHGKFKNPDALKKAVYNAMIAKRSAAE